MSRQVGPFGLSAHIFNCTVGGGIYRLPVVIYLTAGPSAPWAYLFCGGLYVVMAVVFVFLAQGTSSSGGPCEYVRTPLGNRASHVVAQLQVLFSLLAMTAVLRALCDLFPVPTPLSLIPLVAIIVGLNLLPISRVTVVSKLLMVLKLLPLFAVIGAAFMVNPASFAVVPPLPSPSTLGQSLLILVFAYMGMESALVPGREIRNPRRTIPKALFLAVLVVLVLYTLLQQALQSLYSDMSGDLSLNPLGHAAGALLGPYGYTFMTATVGVSMFGFLLSMTMATSRIIVVTAGKIHGRVVSMRQALVACAMVLGIGGVSQGFETLVVAANIAALIVYALCMVAAIKRSAVFSQTRGSTTVSHTKSIGVLAVISLVAILAVLFQAKPVEWITLGLLYALLAALSHGIYWVHTRHLPYKKVPNPDRSPQLFQGDITHEE